MNFPELFGQLGNAPHWLIGSVALLAILIVWRILATPRTPRRHAGRAYYRGVIKRIPPHEHLLTYHGRR
jgi:hypothetical protein